MTLNRLFFPALVLLMITTSRAPAWQVWPSPPDRPRISHLQTISSPGDLNIESGFFAKLLNLIVGKDESKSWLVQPVGITVEGSGKIYIADPGAAGVHMIDRRNRDYAFIQSTPFGPLVSPTGVAVAGDGRLYVSDAERREVVVFDEDGDAEFRITERLTRPTGLAIHNDVLYVADAHGHRVLMFGLGGSYRGEFGRRGTENGNFNFPVALAVRGTSFIVDALNYRIQEFDSAGTFRNLFGRQGNASGSFAAPKSIAMDSDNNLYVTDALMDNVQLFNTRGELLLVVGRRGNGNGEFMSPNGIAIDREDNVYIVDALNKRLQIFRYLK